MPSLTTLFTTFLLSSTAFSASITKRAYDCTTHKCMHPMNCGSPSGDMYGMNVDGACHCINNYSPTAVDTWYKMYWFCAQDCSVNPRPRRPEVGCGCPVIGEWSWKDPITGLFSCKKECSGGTDPVCGCPAWTVVAKGADGGYRCQ